MSSTPAIIPSDPKLWRKAFLDLRPSVSPCPGLIGANWAAINAKGVDFLDRWADEAVALGWTTLDCWGVHPSLGIIRPDFGGALVMSSDLVTVLTAQRTRFLNATYYQDKLGRMSGAPLWLFGRRRGSLPCYRPP